MFRKRSAPYSIKLPLVSVVITAHNYGRFLRQAIASVMAQTYRDVECIVVDDGSTDETSEVLARCLSDFRNLKILTNSASRGQGAAGRAGFAASSGQYVVLMDADDVLLPPFVATHIFVQLSSRIHAGLTSSDIYQEVDGRLVISTGEALNVYLRSHAPTGEAYFRPVSRKPNGPWPYEVPDRTILADVRLVPPAHVDWCWSPTTANMFRRDALALVADCEEFEQMRLGADVYLCTGINALCGSLLIDRPLSIYRLHGSNSGSYQAQLQNVRTVKPESELSVEARQLLIQSMTRNFAILCGKLWYPEPLIAALDGLAPASGRGGSFLVSCLEDKREPIARVLGDHQFDHWLEKVRSR